MVCLNNANVCYSLPKLLKIACSICLMFINMDIQGNHYAGLIEPPTHYCNIRYSWWIDTQLLYNKYWDIFLSAEHVCHLFDKIAC